MATEHLVTSGVCLKCGAVHRVRLRFRVGNKPPDVVNYRMACGKCGHASNLTFPISAEAAFEFALKPSTN